jgi:hypothetical protein
VNHHDLRRSDLGRIHPESIFALSWRFPNTAETAVQRTRPAWPSLTLRPSRPLLSPPWDGDRTTALPASIATLACVRGGMAYDAHSRPLAGFVWLRLSHHAVQGLPRSRQCHRDCFVNS